MATIKFDAVVIFDSETVLELITGAGVGLKKPFTESEHYDTIMEELQGLTEPYTPESRSIEEIAKIHESCVDCDFTVKIKLFTGLDVHYAKTLPKYKEDEKR